MEPAPKPFHLDVFFEVVLIDGTVAQAFRSRGRSDHPEGTWLRANPHRYGHIEPVEVKEVIGIAGRKHNDEAA